MIDPSPSTWMEEEDGETSAGLTAHWRRGRLRALRHQVEHEQYVVSSVDVAESIIEAVRELDPDTTP